MGKYVEVKWHGRVGQGVFFAASVLAEILAEEGKYVQAFPEFDIQKKSPFATAYNRLSDSPVRLHSSIENADIVVIMDPALILNAGSDSFPQIKGHTKENASYIVNTPLSPEYIKEKLDAPDSPIYTLDAGAIALEEAGEFFPNIPVMAVTITFIDGIPIEIFKQRLNESLIHKYRFDNDRAAANLKAVDRGLKEVKKLKIEN